MSEAQLDHAVGGFYVTSIPVWISWLKYLSFVYYGELSSSTHCVQHAPCTAAMLLSL